MGSELPEGELGPGLVTAASPAWSAVKARLCEGASEEWISPSLLWHPGAAEGALA